MDAPRLVLGTAWDFGTASYLAPFKGEIHDLRLWGGRCLTPGQVAELSADPWGMYRPIIPVIRGLNLSGVTPDTTPPTVTLVSPAEGQIAAGDEVVIDVTSTVGLRLVVLSLALPADAGSLALPSEVIYRSSTGFAPGYEGSTLNTITNGVRATMKRTAGWPRRTLRFDPDVVTTTGAINP